jgi:hypothetical protein
MLKVNRRFGETLSPSSSGSRTELSKKPVWKMARRAVSLLKFWDYVGNRREMEESSSVLVGLPVGHVNRQYPLTFTQQPSEQAGYNGINSITLKKGGFAGL